MIFCITRDVEQAKAGDRRVGCWDGKGEWHDGQPFVLVAEKTKSEYFAFCDSEGSPVGVFETLWIANNPCRYFEVALD